MTYQTHLVQSALRRQSIPLPIQPFGSNLTCGEDGELETGAVNMIHLLKIVSKLTHCNPINLRVVGHVIIPVECPLSETNG